MPEISPETFAHMVELAALELDEEEAEYLRGELNNQLTSIHELEAIPLDEEPTTYHGIPYTPDISPETRRDEVVPFLDAEEIVKGAPETEGGYIVVPDIPHEELE